MDFANERVPGMVPDFGAIFMSNSETRMECLRRNVFGLPSSQAAFVKQVKAGMVLFLFEFDRKQLHGVFQACSDGAMNIVPHAFSSSGKQFPAQVKFTTIWKCDPLSEYEFRDAIKDNYFSANKFNFGLSEDQVHHLLLLFSRRKLKKPLPPKQFTRNKITEPPGKALHKVRAVVDNGMFVMPDKVEIKNDNDVEYFLEPVISSEYSMGKERRVTDDDRFPTRYRVGNNEHLLDNDLEPSILIESPGHALVKMNILPDDGRLASSYELGKKCYTGNDFDPVRLADEDSFMANYKVENNCNLDNGEYRGNSFCEARRVADDDKFTISDRFENDHNMDNGPNSAILSRNSANSLGKVERVADDGRFRTSDRQENGCNFDIGLRPVISTKYPSLYPSSVAPRVYSNNRSLEINNSLVQELMPSTFSRSTEPWISKLSYSRVHGDAIISSPVSCDPEAPSIQYERSSSFGVNPVNECTPPETNVLRNIYSSFKNQSFQLHHMQPKALIKQPYVASGIENYVPFSAPYYCKCTYCVADIHPSRAGYSENKAVKPADYEGYEGVSFSKSSLSTMPVGRSGNHGLKDRGFSLSSSPNKNPSYVSDVGSVVSDEKYEHKTPWRENDQAHTANFCLPNCNQCHMQGGLDSLESTEVNFNESRGFSHNVEYHLASKGVNFDTRKKRNSVFSRLTVALEVNEQENDIHRGCNEGDMDISVDEIMGMLHRGHNCWVKKPRKCTDTVRLSEDGENSRDKRHTTFIIQKFRNDSIAVPNQMNMYQNSANEENLNSIDQGRPIVDFKRRSQVRKKVEKTTSRGCVDIAESEASLSNQPKRRKLVRPDFRNNDLSNDKGDGDGFTSLNELSQEASVIKDNTVNTGAHSSLSNQRKKLVRPDFRNNDLSNDKGNGDSFTRLNESSQEASVIKEEAFIGGCDIDKIGGSKCEAERRPESYEESFVSGVEDGQDLSQNVVMKNVPFSVSCEVKSHNDVEGFSGKEIMVNGFSQNHNTTCSSDEQKLSLQIHEGDAMSGITLVGIDHGRDNEGILNV